MSPDSWYSNYYKDHNKRVFIDKKPLEPAKKIEIDKSDQPKLLPKEKQIEVINELKRKISYVPEKRTYSNNENPNIIRIIMVLIILIPIIIIAYILYLNFFANHVFTYTYDIGSSTDNYLSPSQRISDKISDGNETYRNLTGSLVYFNVDVPRGSNNIKIITRYKDDLSNDSVIRLGAKDQDIWHYSYKTIYNPMLNNLGEFKSYENVYLVNPRLYLVPVSDIIYERDVVVAMDKPYTPIPNIISDYNDSTTIINSTLRGAHTFYIYASGDLDIQVKKQDLNWYADSDDLYVTLYDTEGYVLGNMTIPDDGIITVNKTPADIQSTEMQINSLIEGVYILEFSSFDGMIKEIKVNSNKIVADNIFLADNALYNQNTSISKVFTRLNRDSDIKLITYHQNGLQNISYGVNKTYIYNTEDVPAYLSLRKGDYYLTFPKNDIIVSYPGYFAFNKDNYFDPFRQRVIQIPNDMSWIKKNVDYLVTDYIPPVQDGDWLISETNFDISDDDLYVKDNKLNFVISVPNIGPEQNESFTVQIDYIKVTVDKPGVFS